MMLGRAIDTSTRTASINTDSMSVGSVAANALTGFDHIAGKVFASGTQKYFTAPDGASQQTSAPVFTTKAVGRDQEWTGWAYVCRVYMRYANERAILFNVNPVSNEFSVTFITALTPSGTSNTYGTGSYAIRSQVTLSSLIPGYSANQDTDLFTFGCVGPDLYAKYNGTTFWTAKFWQHVVAGKIMGQVNSSEFGFRDVVCSFLSQADGYSDYSNKVLDPRDWGFKALTTTGSMTAASTTLTVASNPGFAIGDKIIVETGGEAGAGALGTKGVGGTWPTYSYANEASLPNHTTFRNTYAAGSDGYAWLEDTGKVWVATSSGWGNFTDAYADPTFWYWKRVVPRALRATITNIVGTTFTLDTAATVSTTNANVYYDCSDAFTNTLGKTGSTDTSHPNKWVTDFTFRMPSGTYAGEGFFGFGTTANLTMEGAGRSFTTLYTPKGCANLAFVQNGEAATFLDFKIVGQAGEQYWCHESAANFDDLRYCISIDGFISNPVVERIDQLNCWGGPKISNAFNGAVSDCDAVQNNGNLQQYFTWYYGPAYCTDTWYTDCNYTADKIGSAYELFGADGGGFRDCTSVNGYVASNTSGGYEMDNMSVTLDMNDYPTSQWTGDDAIGFNININIGGGSTNPGVINQGGIIRNPTINITKRTSNGGMGFAIVVQSGLPSVQIIGTHTAKPGTGVITMSDYAPGDTGKGAVGIVLDGTNCTVSGIRVIGTASGGGTFDNISLRNSTHTVQNSVADAIEQYTGSVYVNRLGTNGNITNAQYAAL